MGLIAGLVLAIVAVYLVLQPLLHVAQGRNVEVAEPLFFDSDDEDDPVAARKARALAALKEIDFDRATGKLSDDDYETLKAEFTADALEALREEERGEGNGERETLSPLPTPLSPVDALIAEARTRLSSRRFCLECGEPVSGNNRFCMACGAPLEATI